MSPAPRRPPRSCPVCSHELVVTGLGCPECGTGISGTFTTSAYDALTPAELEMLRVFLVSRGNMRELEKHLGVSYPTTRARFSALLAKLGFEQPPPDEEHRADPADPGHVRGLAETEDVLADLAAGRISVEEAEDLLRH